MLVGSTRRRPGVQTEAAVVEGPAGHEVPELELVSDILLRGSEHGGGLESCGVGPGPRMSPYGGFSLHSG